MNTISIPHVICSSIWQCRNQTPATTTYPKPDEFNWRNTALLVQVVVVSMYTSTVATKTSYYLPRIWVVLYYRSIHPS
jgi:hypothetical protein